MTMHKELTEEEVERIDTAMSNHLQHHPVSNEGKKMPCEPDCRKQVLRSVINNVLNSRTQENEDGTTTTTQN